MAILPDCYMAFYFLHYTTMVDVMPAKVGLVSFSAGHHLTRRPLQFYADPLMPENTEIVFDVHFFYPL